MFVIIDKASSNLYKQNAYVSENKRDVVLFSCFARKFRTLKNAQKFINKTFTNSLNYDIIKI